MSGEALDTPVAVVDLTIMEANISRAQQFLDAHGIGNRPHIKTQLYDSIASNEPVMI